MIKKLALFSLLLSVSKVFACEACQRQQPAITKGWTHGIGPQNNYDWFIVGSMGIITLLVLVYSIKYLVKPGEKDSSHIKNSIILN